VRVKAVVFDLWETLIDWDAEVNAAMHERIDALTGPGFRERWQAAGNRYVAPIRDVLAGAGVPAEAMEAVCAVRSDFVRQSLVPRDGAVETLRTLRERGYLVGLITVCTEEVELLWPESEFAGLFDAEVFSNSVGMSKPDPRIYRRCCELLGVEPAEAIFVGDGANDELAGARRVGMEAILIHRPGEDPFWPEVQAWDGPRVTSIPQVLEVLERC
jgi:putative hydrolase of the HAD superfamily